MTTKPILTFLAIVALMLILLFITGHSTPKDLDENYV